MGADLHPKYDWRRASRCGPDWLRFTWAPTSTEASWISRIDVVSAAERARRGEAQALRVRGWRWSPVSDGRGGVLSACSFTGDRAGDRHKRRHRHVDTNCFVTCNEVVEEQSAVDAYTDGRHGEQGVGEERNGGVREERGV